MGRGGHGDDEGTPYDQTLDELDFLRSACAAAQRGQAEQLRTLLTRRGASVALGGGAVGGRGYTPLHYAAREGRLECAQILLDAGAAVDARTAAGGATALHRAAFTGRADVVALLLRRGADAALQDVDGETALHKAAAQGHAEATRALLAACPAAAALRDRHGHTPSESATGDAAPLLRRTPE